jgi:hypothetical protein
MYYTKIFVCIILIILLNGCTSYKQHHQPPIILIDPLILDENLLNICKRPSTLEEDLEVKSLSEYSKLDIVERNKKLTHALTVNKFKSIECYKAFVRIKTALKEQGVNETHRIQ